MTGDAQRTEGSGHKNGDLAVLRKVWANRQFKPQDSPQSPKAKAEKADKPEQQGQPMPARGVGKTKSNPFVIDDD
jgi:hypothetical protein